MKNEKKIMNRASVLLIAAVMILSALAVTANTEDETQGFIVGREGFISDNPQISTPSSQALTTDTFFEGFEGGVLPDGWLNIDNDGDGFKWSVVTLPGHPPHSGEYSMMSESWQPPNNPLTPDNFLITPPLTVTDASELSYWVAAQDPAWSQERIQIWISTTTPEIDSFTHKVDDYTCPAGSNQFVERVVSLASFALETIYIAFRHCESTDWFQIKIDDVTVTNIFTSEPPEDIPDLSCAGSLNWASITPGDTVTGTFTVSNVGDAGSLLNWEIQSYPSWGTWTFTPESGVGLTPEAGAVTVTVEVVAPMDKNTEFTGQVVLVNSDNSSDTCIIEVVLATPVSYQSPFMVFIQRLVQRFPLLAFIFNLL
jgi:hypothetical protein